MTKYTEYKFRPIKVREDLEGLYGPVSDLIHFAKKEKLHDFIKLADQLFPGLSDETLLAAYNFFCEAEPRLEGDELLTEPVRMSGLLDLLPFLGCIAQPGSLVTVEADGHPFLERVVREDGSLD